METKTCTGKNGCYVEKPISEFYLTKYKKPDNICKKCHALVNWKREKKNILKVRPMKAQGRPKRETETVTENVSDLFSRKLVK